MSVLPRPFSSETGLPDRALVRSRDRRRPIPPRQKILKSSVVRSTLMLAPKRQVVLLANSLGQGIVPLVFAYVSHLPVSVRLQRRFRSSYLIGIAKKNAIMMINFGPRGRAQPGP